MEDPAVDPVPEEVGPGPQHRPVEGEAAVAAGVGEVDHPSAEAALPGGGGQPHAQLLAHQVLEGQIGPLGNELQGELEGHGQAFAAFEAVQEEVVA